MKKKKPKIRRDKKERPFTPAPPYSPLWKKLYASIGKFMEAAPWTVFCDVDIFIVQSPEDGQWYLCSIMGNGGREFGLNAFRGEQGMRSFHKMVYRDYDGPLDRSLQFEMDMLSFTLSRREELDPRDLSVTKKLLLSFPGGSWPLLRSYRPHYIPWFLTEPEIRTLTLCLDQVLDLAKEGEKTLDAMRSAGRSKILLRCLENNAWRSRLIRVGFVKQEEVPVVELDDITLQRLRDLPADGPAEEIDLEHLFAPIMDHEPPYFGLMAIGINERPFASQYGMFAPFDDFYRSAVNKILEAFLSRGNKPVRVLLKEGSPFADVFEPVCRQAGLVCERRADLPLITDLITTMEKSMEDGSFGGGPPD